MRKMLAVWMVALLVVAGAQVLGLAAGGGDASIQVALPED